MPARHADNFLSTSIEVFQQLDKPQHAEATDPGNCVAKKQEVGLPKTLHVVDRRCWQIQNTPFLKLLSEFVGHQADRGHPQYNEGDLTVSFATARRVEV